MLSIVKTELDAACVRAAMKSDSTIGKSTLSPALNVGFILSCAAHAGEAAHQAPWLLLN